MECAYGYLRYSSLLLHRDRQSICHCHQVSPWQRMHILLDHKVDLYLLGSRSGTHVLPDPLSGLVPTESGVLDFPRTTTTSNVQQNCRGSTSTSASSGFPGGRTSKLPPAHAPRVCLRVLVLSRLFRRQLLQSHQLMQRIYYQVQLVFLIVFFLHGWAHTILPRWNTLTEPGARLHAHTVSGFCATVEAGLGPFVFVPTDALVPTFF